MLDIAYYMNMNYGKMNKTLYFSETDRNNKEN